jgi:hypothetical protein
MSHADDAALHLQDIASVSELTQVTVLFIFEACTADSTTDDFGSDHQMRHDERRPGSECMRSPNSSDNLKELSLWADSVNP